MSLFDAFKYDCLRVVVVGAATGMGNAVAQLAADAGAEVVAMVSGFVQSRLWVHNLVSLISVDRWLRGLGIGSAVS